MSPPRKSTEPRKGSPGSAALPPLPPLGAHMSVAGGVDRALDRARKAGCTALQIFLKNNNQWKGPLIADSALERWRSELAKNDLLLAPPIAHASYLLNLASADDALVAKSLDNLIDDVRRADLLGVSGIVLHPGAHMGDGDAVGIERIAKNLDRLFDATADARAHIYLENTAGQGSAIGWRFEHLRDILAGVRDASRLGVCLDTCHTFAAGYDVRTRDAFAATMAEFDRVVGLDRLRAIHVNDSKKGLGSRVDRHEHIGKGEIGEEGFAALLADERLRFLPHTLETPKEEDLAEDIENLATLRRLAARG